MGFFSDRNRNRKPKQTQSKKRCSLEQLEARTLLAALWRNPADNLDVNQDGSITPVDAVQVINDLNANGIRPLSGSKPSGSPFVDSQGDGSATPLDALFVINHLNLLGSGLRSLAAGSRFDSSQEVAITTGNSNAGARIFRAEIASLLDSRTQSQVLKDLFSVYVVNPQDRQSTLIDRGQNGSSVFTLYADGSSELALGLTRWDGRYLEIDLTGVTTTETALLRFELTTTRSDSNSRIQWQSIENTIRNEQLPGNLIPDRTTVHSPGTPLNTIAFTPSESFATFLSSPRIDISSGRLDIDLSIQNNGEALGKSLAIAFPNLPAGITLRNASGIDQQGSPYINLAPSIQEGGLGKLQATEKLRLEFSNPSRRPFSLQPKLWAGLPNRAPVLPDISAKSVMPGDRIQIDLAASDPDGDRIEYSVSNANGGALPTGSIDLDSQKLTFEPSPAQIGTFTVALKASDGVLSETKTFVLHVADDPIKTTRVSGRVLDVDGTPLSGLRVEIGTLQNLTNSEGFFQIDLGSGPVASETLRVRGDLYGSAAKYPFIAEKLPFMLSHDVYTGFNNVLHRPIYLPKLDIANGQQIDPTKNIDVVTPTLPGVGLEIVASSLRTQDGTPFNGILSITEVPPNLTPASLPDGVRPDMVLTIQPGEMVFTTPAPLRFPNRSGYPAGMILNLMSINPVTGEFEDVGDLKVTPDGQSLETISGGVRNSSWHYPEPDPPRPSRTPSGTRGPRGGGCGGGQCCAPPAMGNFRVLCQTGTVQRSYELPTYNSAGLVHAVSLQYDSGRTHRVPETVELTFSNLGSLPAGVSPRLELLVELYRDGVSIPAQISSKNAILTEGNKVQWAIADKENGSFSINLNTNNLQEGSYNIVYKSRIVGNQGTGSFSSRYSQQTSQITLIDASNTEFGYGWRMQGLLKIVRSQSGVTLVDGNGEYFFTAIDGLANQWSAPDGDFSSLRLLADNTFERTFKDGSLHRFDPLDRISLKQDRNGRTWRYEYGIDGAISAIIDPAGLRTLFNSIDGKIKSIRDPFDRTTIFDHDTRGDLVTAKLPNNAVDKWTYDIRHRMTSHTNSKNEKESVFYDTDGRATYGLKKDGSRQEYIPSQFTLERNFSRYIGPDGSTSITLLDSIGRHKGSMDSLGTSSSKNYNSDNLLNTSFDGLGNATKYHYDNRGNVTRIEDDVTGVGLTPTIRWLGIANANWNNPANWSTGKIPGPEDVVEVIAPGSTISISDSNVSVKSVYSSAMISLQGRELTISGFSYLRGGLVASSGSSLKVAEGRLIVSSLEMTDSSIVSLNSGILRVTGDAKVLTGFIHASQFAQIRLEGPTNFNGSLLKSESGGVISIPRAVEYKSRSSIGENEKLVLFSSTGTGSLIDLSSLESIDALWTAPWWGAQQLIEAKDGGQINLSGLTALTAGDDGNDGVFEIRSNGGSVVNLSSLRTISGRNNGILISIDDSAIEFPDLVQATRLHFTIQTGQSLSLPKLTHYAEGTLEVRNNATVSAPLLSHLQATKLSLAGSARINAPSLETIDESTIAASNGATFTLPSRITSYKSRSSIAENEKWMLFSAVGLGSLIDLSSLASIDALWTAPWWGAQQLIEAKDGGQINLSGLTALTAGDDGNDGVFEIRSDGGSVVNLSSLRTISGRNNGILISIDDSAIEFPDLVQATRLHFTIQTGQSLSLPKLTHYAEGTLEVRNNATVSAPLLSHLQATKLSLAGSARMNAPSLETIDESTIAASGGATFTLPSRITSYKSRSSIAENEKWMLFSAVGVGSLIDLSSLASIDALWTAPWWGAQQLIEAKDSGQINLSGLTALTAGGDGDDGTCEVRAISQGMVHLPSLKIIQGRGSGFKLSFDGPSFTLPELTQATLFSATVASGQTLSMPKLFVHQQGNLQVQDGGTVVAPVMTHLNGIILQLAGNGQLVAPLIESIDESSIWVSQGATFVLPSRITTYKSRSVMGPDETLYLFVANGTGSRIDLSPIRTMEILWSGQAWRGAQQIIESKNGGKIDLSGLQTLTAGDTGAHSPLEVRTINGGEMDLSKLQSIAGRGNGVNLAFGSNLFELPELTQATLFSATVASGQTLSMPKLLVHQQGNLQVQDGGTVVAPVMTHLNGIILQLAGNGQLIAPLIESIDESSISASQGATFVLPSRITTYKSRSVMGPDETLYLFVANGTGSRIDLSPIRTMETLWSGQAWRGAQQIIESKNGGKIDLSGLQILTAGDTGAHSPLEVRTINGGEMDLSKLQSIAGRGNGVAFEFSTAIASIPELLEANRANFLVADGNTLLLPKINILDGNVFLGVSSSLNANELVPLIFSRGNFSLANGSTVKGKRLIVDSVLANLSGNGTIIGDVENRGIISPGADSTPGKISIQGNYTQSSNGKLVIDLAGNNAGITYDQLSVTGAATLGGNLQIAQKSGYSPGSGTTFQPLVAQTIAGQFASYSGLGLANGTVLEPAYSSDRVVLTVSGSGEGESPSLLDYHRYWLSYFQNVGRIYGPVWIPETGFPEPQIGSLASNSLPYETDEVGEGEGNNSTSTIVSLPEEWEYEPKFNQLIRYQDGNGNLTLYTIDSANGNRLSSRRVIGQVDSTQNGETDDLVTTFTYTTFGLIDKVTDPLGRITDYDYDPLGRLVKLTEAAGSTIATFETYEYDLYGNMTARVDARGFRSTMEYDVMNRMTKMTSPDPDGTGPLTASSTIFEYDAMGQLLRTVDARGSESTMTYDAMGRMVTQTNDAGKTTRNTYDLAGNRIAVTDANGNTTRYKYDARKRMTESIAADGGVTKYQYDLANNLTSLTDPVGNRTQFRYDARNRMIEEIDPLGKSIRYEYDGVGNIANKIDRNGRTTIFEYDDANRLAKETWRNAEGTTANVITYSYDKVGNLLGVQDQASKLTYKYDDLNRPIEVTNTGTPSAPLVELDYAFDPAGNIESVTDTIFGNLAGTTSYAYDGQNRMSSASQSGTGVDPKLVDFVYNELGQFSQIDRHNDLQRSSLVARSRYSYDDLNRLTSLTHGSVSNPRSLAFYDYEYDAADRITAITDIDGRTDYRYDVTNQLTGATRGSSDPRGNETYRYDRNGNRISSHLAATYSTGASNRLLSDGTYNYTYDSEGNMSRRVEIATGETRDFTWDHRNRLVQVSDKSSGGIIINEAFYTYDALNRRIAKTVDTDGTGPNIPMTEHYIYDGEHIALEFQDADGPGSAQQPVLALRNLFGPRIDMILAQEYEQGNQTRWLLTDHLGTVRDIINGPTAVLNHIRYDSFGNILSQSTPASASRYAFTGREWDAKLSLYYYRARYYEAGVGQFISEDSIRFSSDTLNLHGYVLNQPIHFVDPSGENPLVWIVTNPLVVLECGKGALEGALDAAGQGDMPPDPDPISFACGQVSKAVTKTCIKITEQLIDEYERNKRQMIENCQASGGTYCYRGPGRPPGPVFDGPPPGYSGPRPWGF